MFPKIEDVDPRQRSTNCTRQLGLAFSVPGLMGGSRLETNVKRHVRFAYLFRGTFLPLVHLLRVRQNPWSLKCRKIKTRTINRISKAARVASKAAVASRNPISKISSRARSPVRADSKAVNRADSRTEVIFSDPSHSPPALMLGAFYCA